MYISISIYENIISLNSSSPLDLHCDSILSISVLTILTAVELENREKDRCMHETELKIHFTICNTTRAADAEGNHQNSEVRIVLWFLTTNLNQNKKLLFYNDFGLCQLHRNKIWLSLKDIDGIIKFIWIIRTKEVKFW